MKKLLCFLLLCSAAAFGQTISGIITGTGCLQVNVAGAGVVGIVVTNSGTAWTGTIQPQIIIENDPNGTTGNAQVTPYSSSTAQATITANGTYSASVSGATFFQVCGATVTNNAQIRLTPVKLASQRGSGGGLPSGSIVSSIPQTGLLGLYDFNQGSGTSLTDVSGNGNNGTLCAAGAAPAWIANTGGLAFTGSAHQCVTLPSALNTTKTFVIAYSFNASQNFAASGGTSWAGLVSANTGGSAALSMLGFYSTFGGSSALDPPTTQDLLSVIWNATGTTASGYENSGQGTHVITFENSAPDSLYIDGAAVLPLGSQTSTWTPVSIWQFGGGSPNTSWYTGNIYYAAAYSTVLTQAQITQATVAINQALKQRGITSPSYGPTTSVDVINFSGDSIAVAYAFNLAGAQEWAVNIAITGSPTIWNSAVGGAQLITQLLPNISAQLNMYSANGQRNLVFDQAGRNDFILGSATAAQMGGAMYNTAQQVRRNGAKFLVGTVLCDSSNAATATYNAYLRAHWSEFADGLVDWASNANLGGTNCNSNGAPYWLADTIHPAIYAYDFLGYYTQVAVNRLYGNHDWSSANVYTTAAPAATATTAMTDAAALTGNPSNSVATYTFAANPFTQGQMVTCTGGTPAGYNTTFTVLPGATGTVITGYINNAALGAQSVAANCTTPQQQDVDQYVRLAGSATSPSFTLQTACGYINQDIFIKNENTTSPWVLTPWGTETIDGAATLTMPVATSGNFPVVQLRATLATPSTPVCSWKRMR